VEGRGLGKQYEETGAIDAVRSSDEKGLKGYCFLDAAASSMYMTMDSSAATAPPANQPSAPSFQVRSSENPTIRPIIPQTNAPNAPNLPSQIVHWSIAATPSFDGLRIHSEPHSATEEHRSTEGGVFSGCQRTGATNWREGEN
jgi:hypothetical protein